MSINFNKVSFNELDDEYPVKVFYNYALSENELNEWIANEIEDELPNEWFVGVELVLTIFNKHDFKLEAVFTSETREQHWVELEQFMRNADEFITLIPNYGKMRLFY